MRKRTGDDSGPVGDDPGDEQEETFLRSAPEYLRVAANPGRGINVRRSEARR